MTEKRGMEEKEKLQQIVEMTVQGQGENSESLLDVQQGAVGQRRR